MLKNASRRFSTFGHDNHVHFRETETTTNSKAHPIKSFNFEISGGILPGCSKLYELFLFFWLITTSFSAASSWFCAWIDADCVVSEDVILAHVLEVTKIHNFSFVLGAGGVRGLPMTSVLMEDVITQVPAPSYIPKLTLYSKVFMQEVRNTSSLEWHMQAEERARVVCALTGLSPPSTSHDKKVASFKADPLHASDYFQARNALRHDSHWKALSNLAPSKTSPVKPALDACRLIVFQFLHRGHISVVRSRQESSLWGWAESDFEAVFGSLRGVDSYEPVPSPTSSKSAPTFEAAWGGTGIYQSQISCPVGSKLEDWCSFEDWPQRDGRTHCGCALLASTTVRFLLELTILFRCNATRVAGRKTEVRLLMTKATFNSKKELKVQPPPSKKQTDVRAGLFAIEKAQTYMSALNVFKDELHDASNK